MPIKPCKLPKGGDGFQWGNSGKCFATHAEAEKQAEAAYANGYTGDTLSVAKDATPNREYGRDGHLHIYKSNISKAAVNSYYGREVPGGAALGLEPDKIYQFLRHPDELRKAASSFERMPILSRHVPITTKMFPPHLVVGTIGSDVTFEDPYLQADLAFWTDTAIAGIESETVRELSCCYHWTPVMQSGDYNGVHYDGIMTNIEGNHLAQVESGRAGSDVFAADSKPEIPKMKMTKLGKALFVALGAASPKLAQDAALPALVGTAAKKTFDKPTVKTKLLAMDADLESDQVEDLIESILDCESSPEPIEPRARDKKAKDAEEDEETEEEKEKRLAREKKAKDKKAKDAEMDEKEKKAKDNDVEDISTAMDSLRREFREADEARRIVRPIVGDVAMDSAPEIYGFALDHLKVDRTGVKELSGLKALTTLAFAGRQTAPAVVAMDSASTVKQFPQAARFSRA